MEHREHQAEPNGKSRASLSEVRGRSSFGCIKRSVASMSMMQAVSANRQGGFVVLLLYGGIAFLFFGSVHSWSRYYLGTGPDPLTYIWGLNWWPWAIQHGLNPLVTRFAWYPTGFHTAWADLAGSLNALGSVSGHERFPLHGPAEGFRHGGIEVGDETLDPLLKMFLRCEIARRRSFLTRIENQISIWLIQDACFGVKWNVMRWLPECRVAID